MRLRWTFLTFLLCLVSPSSAAGQAVDPATLKPPTPHPVTPITVPTHFCSEAEKATAIATAGLDTQKDIGMWWDAGLYEGGGGRGPGFLPGDPSTER